MILLLLPPSPSLPANSFSSSSSPHRRSCRRSIPSPITHHHRLFLFRLNAIPAAAAAASSPTTTTAAAAPALDDDDYFTKYSGYLFDQLTDSSSLLTDYNISTIASIYNKKPLLLLRRLLQLASTIGIWLAKRYLDAALLNHRSDQMFQVRAAELRNILLQLGPAYIKIAQAISSRPDLIPPSYLNELSLLQDSISPFSDEIAFNTIEKELGVPIDELFSEISPNPVAAASLGQVYQARLRRTGRVVAVKVQRPGVQAAIALDILILRFLAGILRRVGKFNTDLQGVVDEWASSLFREMNYKNEAKNGLKFKELYGGIKDVLVPEMLSDLTTRKVLIMEWVEGGRLSEGKDLYLVEVGVYCSFNQLLECGFYHADPHPGNLLRTYDGKLAYLDFGMMGEFKQELREGFIEACLHLINRDYDALAKDFITLGLLPPTAEKDAVTKALTGVFQNAVSKGVSNISFGDLLGNLGTTMYKFKFQIPSYFSLVIRSLAVLEGIAISFNPNYKVLGSTYPWIARKVLTDSSPQLQASLQALLYKDGIFRIDRLESLLNESLRAKTERITVQNQLEDSRMTIKQVLSFTLTEKGTFVREILLEELAKGLDALGLSTFSSSITEEDKMNLRNMERIVLLLSGLRENGTSGKGLEEEVYPNERQRLPLLFLRQTGSMQEILPLLSSIIPELPSEIQQKLLLLPADLGGKLISRAAARTIRRFFLIGP
ncbi:uncharacterized aarF domain-containing protein kinase At1g71810, chloroplastic isoform X1 [Impatiens glandulifera]|uniref:uncharacterized aarF domain-containing protein kinase At1g71810, chloroplastic isoform X1 n=1 Tax=Impatiens glandulifera TaxID=253017 RepID=UPI001FB07A55|nr:uncharacterized aarF domain-containing protein kinase At1g71810, chloroplastic isoform X1 [Impatiens glandulifera]